MYVSKEIANTLELIHLPFSTIFPLFPLFSTIRYYLFLAKPTSIYLITTPFQPKEQPGTQHPRTYALHNILSQLYN